MKPHFYLRRGDRLAARLRHILYAWRFTRKAGAKLHVFGSEQPASPDDRGPVVFHPRRGAASLHCGCCSAMG